MNPYCLQSILITDLITGQQEDKASILTVRYSICQVLLMSILSVNHPDRGLFIAIDNELLESGYEVIFTVHIDRFNEANSLVPLLYILLEANFGIPIHELGWFTDDAKRVVTKYK